MPRTVISKYRKYGGGISATFTSKEKQSYVTYKSCNGHSLHLVGHAAVDNCLDTVNVFVIVPKYIYLLFIFYKEVRSVLLSFLNVDSKVPILKYLPADTIGGRHVSKQCLP